MSRLLSQPSHPITRDVLTQQYHLPGPPPPGLRDAKVPPGLIATGTTIDPLTVLPKANRRDAQVACKNQFHLYLTNTVVVMAEQSPLLLLLLLLLLFLSLAVADPTPNITRGRTQGTAQPAGERTHTRKHQNSSPSFPSPPSSLPLNASPPSTCVPSCPPFPFFPLHLLFLHFLSLLLLLQPAAEIVLNPPPVQPKTMQVQKLV